MKVNYIRSFINALSGFKKDYSVVHTLKADDPRKVIQLKASLNFGFPTNLVFGFKSGHDFDRKGFGRFHPLGWNSKKPKVFNFQATNLIIKNDLSWT